MLDDDCSRPRRHMRVSDQSGMPLGLEAAASGDLSLPLMNANSAAVSSTGSAQTAKLASQLPTSGRITGSVRAAPSSSPTSRPFDQNPVARVIARGNQLRTRAGKVGWQML